MNKNGAFRASGAAAIAAMALAFAASSATSAQAAGTLTLTDFYSDGKIIDTKVTIAPNDISALKAAPTSYVPATVEFTSPTGTSGVINIGFKLKGSTSLTGETDLADITARPSIKIKFDYKSLSKQRYLGLKHLTLNSMNQDTSHVHEFSAYKLFNAMKVPAPSTGWSHLTVNGVDRGLYVNVETVDDIYLSKHFATPSQHLYDSVALADLKPGHDDGASNTGAYPVVLGYKQNPSKADLGKLIAAANSSLPAWWKQMATVTDRAEFIREFAVENFIGHWDGYSGPIINNYYLRDDMGDKFSIMPWGTDQTFGENRATTAAGDMYRFSMTAPKVGFPWIKTVMHVATSNRGLLFRNCLAYTPCFKEYLQDLKATSAMATAMKLPAQIAKAVKLTSPYAVTNTAVETKSMLSFVTLQQKSVAALVAKYKVK